VAQIFQTVRMNDIQEYMERFAASFGVYDIRVPERLPNTRRALAMAEFAREYGKLNIFRDLAMQAHWKDGKDLESDRDLSELATRAITGIPTFIIGNQRVVGCQPYDLLADAARNGGASPKY